LVLYTLDRNLKAPTDQFRLYTMHERFQMTDLCHDDPSAENPLKARVPEEGESRELEHSHTTI
jgi:hypothetical protein